MLDEPMCAEGWGQSVKVVGKGELEKALGGAAGGQPINELVPSSVRGQGRGTREIGCDAPVQAAAQVNRFLGDAVAHACLMQSHVQEA